MYRIAQCYYFSLLLSFRVWKQFRPKCKRAFKGYANFSLMPLELDENGVLSARLGMSHPKLKRAVLCSQSNHKI